MRRKDKEITDKKEIEQIFREAQVCHLGINDEKVPYIIPMNYGYRNNNLYFHSAALGKKLDLLRANSSVSFEIDIPGDTVTSETACSWSMKYRSAMGDGEVVFIDDINEKADALNIIMEHYSAKNNWEFPREMMERILVFKVEVKNLSAKKS